MKNFIEVTCYDNHDKPYQRLINPYWIVDVKPLSEPNVNSAICFIPEDRYERTYNYIIQTKESYTEIKAMLLHLDDEE